MKKQIKKLELGHKGIKEKKKKRENVKKKKKQ